MKLTLTTDRKLVKVGGADFSLTINGKSNTEYGKILAALGVEVEWVEQPKDPIIVPKGTVLLGAEKDNSNAS